MEDLDRVIREYRREYLIRRAYGLDALDKVLLCLCLIIGTSGLMVAGLLALKFYEIFL
jgi:hypothetical protein